MNKYKIECLILISTLCLTYDWLDFPVIHWKYHKPCNCGFKNKSSTKGAKERTFIMKRYFYCWSCDMYYVKASSFFCYRLDVTTWTINYREQSDECSKTFINIKPRSIWSSWGSWKTDFHVEVTGRQYEKLWHKGLRL